jgi:hypothetical protein
MKVFFRSFGDNQEHILVEAPIWLQGSTGSEVNMQDLSGIFGQRSP